MPLSFVGDLRLRQQHRTIVAELHRLLFLDKSKYPDVLDFLRSKVETWGIGRPVPRQRWCHMEAVADVAEKVI